MEVAAAAAKQRTTLKQTRENIVRSKTYLNAAEKGKSGHFHKSIPELEDVTGIQKVVADLVSEAGLKQVFVGTVHEVQPLIGNAYVVAPRGTFMFKTVLTERARGAQAEMLAALVAATSKSAQEKEEFANILLYGNTEQKKTALIEVLSELLREKLVRPFGFEPRNEKKVDNAILLMVNGKSPLRPKDGFSVIEINDNNRGKVRYRRKKSQPWGKRSKPSEDEISDEKSRKRAKAVVIAVETRNLIKEMAAQGGDVAWYASQSVDRLKEVASSLTADGIVCEAVNQALLMAKQAVQKAREKKIKKKKNGKAKVAFKDKDLMVRVREASQVVVEHAASSSMRSEKLKRTVERLIYRVVTALQCKMERGESVLNKGDAIGAAAEKSPPEQFRSLRLAMRSANNALRVRKKDEGMEEVFDVIKVQMDFVLKIFDKINRSRYNNIDEDKEPDSDDSTSEPKGDADGTAPSDKVRIRRGGREGAEKTSMVRICKWCQ